MQVGRNSAGPRWIPVAPDIAVDDQKSLVLEKIQGLRDAAGGFQSLCFGRIRYAGPQVAAVHQGVFDLLSPPGVVGDQAGHAGLGPAPYMPPDQRQVARGSYRER